MNPNPLSDREKALENQWIKEKEKQLARDRAAKKQPPGKDTSDSTDSAGKRQQEQAGQEPK